MTDEEKLEDLTEDEVSDVDDTSETPDEAHRYEEFEDLKNKLDTLESKLDSISSLFVKNISSDETQKIEVEEEDEEIPDENLDLSL